MGKTWGYLVILRGSFAVTLLRIFVLFLILSLHESRVLVAKNSHIGASNNRTPNEAESPSSSVNSKANGSGIQVKPSLGWGSLSGDGSSFVWGLKFEGRYTSKSEIYIGSEIDYLYFGKGSSLAGILATATKKVRVSLRSNRSIGFGLLAGLTIPYKLTHYNVAGLGSYISFSVEQQVDDFSTVVLEFRPGLVQGGMSFILLGGVSFQMF